MYCKECGKQISEDSKFCRYCGTKQDGELSPDDFTVVNHPKDINVNISFGKKEKIDKVNSVSEINPDKPKYDESYEREIEATIVGVIIIIINFVVLIVKNNSGQTDSSIFYPLLVIINLLWRIIVTVWVVNIANRQNRNAGGWGVFAFFIPNLALIIIGLLKKLRVEDGKNDNSLTIDKNQKEEVSATAEENFSDIEYSEGIPKNKFDIILGSYIITKITYSDGITGNIMQGKSTGKYFYLNVLNGKNYCKDKEDCIYQLYEWIK